MIATSPNTLISPFPRLSCDLIGQLSRELWLSLPHSGSLWNHPVPSLGQRSCWLEMHIFVNLINMLGGERKSFPGKLFSPQCLHHIYFHQIKCRYMKMRQGMAEPCLQKVVNKVDKKIDLSTKLFTSNQVLISFLTHFCVPTEC